MREPAGYETQRYVRSLPGGEIELPKAKGWLLRRGVPGYFGVYDAMWPYPLFCCLNWAALPEDLDALERLVSVSLVLDPLGDFDEGLLWRCFPHVAIPFKEHHVVDLAAWEEGVSDHHNRYADKAEKTCEFWKCNNPLAWRDVWVDLYSQLIKRHMIQGIVAFSPPMLILQLSVPGLVMFRAQHAGEVVSMLLFYVQGHKVYYHLGASSEKGYELYASFGLMRYAIRWLAKQGCRWLNLGGGVGVSIAPDDGLGRWKAGWASETRMARFCGRIYDHEAYKRLSRDRETSYFPAYREGEFG